MPTNINDVVKRNGHEIKTVTPRERLALEREKFQSKKETSRAILEAALGENQELKQRLDAFTRLEERTPQLMVIPPALKSGMSESAAVILWSDWHGEERVKSEDVNGMNEFNLGIFQKRAAKLFEGSTRLVDIFKRDTTIKTIVLALLGDFITNMLHEDQQESNELLPAMAADRVEDVLISGIKYLLDTTDEDTVVTVVCHSGNHGRMTKKQRHTTEAGQSLEYLMYCHLRKFFAMLPKYNSRLNWVIAEGYHTFVTLFDRYDIRFHHGHNIRYGGGVGGITIPVNKAIAQWDKVRVANLDAFGHFHTSKSDNKFVANGSLIGYNAYAVAIKAEWEPPSQTFFLVNKGWNQRTITTPIFVEPKRF